MRTPAIAGIAAMAALLAAACGDDADTGGDRLGSGDDYTVAGALAQLPASLSNCERTGGAEEGATTNLSRIVTTGDLTGATEAAGLERPSRADDQQAFFEWLAPMTGGRVDGEHGNVAYVPLPDVFGFTAGVDPGTFHDELGWSVVDSDSYVEFAISETFLGRPRCEPTDLSVVSGPFDDETLSDDLIELGGGVLTDRDGADGEMPRDLRSRIDPFGRPVRLGQVGGQIAVSRQTPSVEAWLDDPEETLADDESFAALAEELDDATAFSAYLLEMEEQYLGASVLLDGYDRSGNTELHDRLESELDTLPPSPFTAIGIGWSADDGAVITIVYQHASDGDAATNAEALEALLTDGTSHTSGQPLSELYDLQDVETDGSLAIVTLRPGPEGHPGTAYDALREHDTPFVHA